jgi:hypothetical protein
MCKYRFPYGETQSYHVRERYISSKDANAVIDVYRTNRPAKEYVEFIQITCKDTKDKWCLEQITQKAREIGADAIVIIDKAGSYGVGIPMGYSAYVVNEEYGMTAIAIRYK